MATAAQSSLLDHVGAWTERDYLALPEDPRRIELLDGGLLVSPTAESRHRRLSSQLWHALGRAAPSRLEVLEAINVRVAPGRILIADLVVVAKPGLDLAVWEPVEVVMVVEIVSPGSVATDRAIKPQLYSAAGIERYLRIELSDPGPCSVAYRLRRGHYVEDASSSPGWRACAWLNRSRWTSTSPPPPARQGDGARSLEQLDGNVDRAVDVRRPPVTSPQRELMFGGHRADERVIDRPPARPSPASEASTAAARSPLSWRNRFSCEALSVRRVRQEGCAGRPNSPPVELGDNRVSAAPGARE
ncbi:MAG: Uma2 family endonuclease [Pseudonocardiales bacterium]|nr:Uma2 family endonuclease [Pseudonocardiales bacterium]MBV9032352.1 Uma2 family endonuclease [Pseudonocardiales bacterium]